MFALLAPYSNAQNKRIQIEFSGFVLSDSLTGKDVTTFVRNDQQQIHITHEDINMWCDKAIYYKNDNFIEAFSNVRMQQGDSINMKADYVEYSGKTQLAFASGDVILTDSQSTLTTDTLYYDRVKQQAFYRSKGKVVRDSSGTITSQIGRYYMNLKKYQFLKDVVLTNPDYTINTNHLDFYSETGHAYLYGPSTIVGEDTKIYCELGFYNTNNDTGYFVKNSRIDYNNRVVEGDSMYFDRKRSFASASNNIKVTDTINKSIIKGHYAEIHHKKDLVFITKRALAITVQENDSIYVHADTLMVTGKPEHRITRAYYNAKIYKSDMSGKADSIHADHKTGITKLINLSRFSSGDAFSAAHKPVMWNIKNQMTGDTIQLISNTETKQLDTLKVFNNAFLISKDTISENGYNQIKGQKLIGLFENNALYNVDIIKNAEVIYYSRNGQNELIGINKSKSGSINIKITDNEINRIRLINQIDGTLYPESQFPEKARKLRGFDWREDERPKSVDDLFSDDPPLKLPVIKGIEEAIPDDDFFDNDLLNRIEKATEDDTKDKKQKTKQNKESKRIPKAILKKRDSLKNNSLPTKKTLIKSKKQ